MSKNFKVGVRMLVYNHEKYLAKAIESVLMQQSDFDYELLIDEDCSTDNSKEIIQHYQKIYPQYVFPIFNKKNIGMSANSRQSWERTINNNYKYIAILDGDDYWTDSHKLQIQVDFLETHSEYSACYHSVQYIDENNCPISVDTTDTFNEDLDVDQKLWPTLTLPGQTGSVVIQNVFHLLPEELMSAYWNCGCNGDMKLPVLMLRYGKLRRIGRNMSCYRVAYNGDSYNARIKGKDTRVIYYLQNLERDKLASLFWEREYFPHYGCIHCVKEILEDIHNNVTDAKAKLSKIVSYDVFKFFSFLVVADIFRICEAKKPFILTSKQMESLAKETYIIFGTGDYGERCYRFLSEINGNITEVWDNDRSKTEFHGFYVRLPHKNVVGKKIVLSTAKYIDDMKRQLIDLGYNDGVDFILFNEFVKNIYFIAMNREYPLLFSKGNCETLETPH